MNIQTPLVLNKLVPYWIVGLIVTAFLAYIFGRQGLSEWGILLALLPGTALGAYLVWLQRRGGSLFASGAGDEAEISGLRQSLVRQIEESAAQQERNRLGRELHDSIKQQLFSIQMSAAALQARLPGDAPAAEQALADVRQSVSAALVEMDALLQQLSPAALEKVGLAQALREQCEALGYRSGAQVTCEIGELPPDERLAPGAQDALFRIAQEALSNIGRHARCQHAWLRLALDESGQNLLLEVRDDGQGFEPDQAVQGRGLNSIRQRLEDLGGNFWLESAPARGTLLRAALPCTQPADAEAEGHFSTATVNRITLLGLAGGALLAGWLFFAPWLTGQSSWTVGLQVVGLVLLIGAGWLAARLAPRGGVISGAAAGGVAGMVAFGLAGAGYAAQQGAQVALAYGLAPAGAEAQGIALIIRSLTGIFGWTQAYFWGLLLAGISLGALGAIVTGRFALPQLPVNWRRHAALLASMAAIGGGLAFTANWVVFSNLEGAVIRAIHDYSLVGVSPQSFSWVMIWSLLTPGLFYLGMLAWRLEILKAERGKKSTFEMERLSWEAFWLAAGSLVVGGLVLVGAGWSWLVDMGRSGSMPWVAGAIALTSLGLGLLFLLELGGLRQQMADLGLPALSILQHLAALLGPLIPLTLLVGLFWLGTGWPALLLAGVELGLLLNLRSRRAKNPPPKVKALVASKALATRLAGSWLGAALALALPALAGISASIGAIVFPIQMITAWLDVSTAAPLLAVEQLVEQNYRCQALGFAGVLVLACMVMGFELAAVNLTTAIRRTRV